MKRSRTGRYLGNQTVLTLKHTEYIRDINPSSAFNLQVEEAVNPGLLSVFPWLGLIGQNFEEYKFHKLCFHFRSHSSDTVLSTNSSTALGSIMMAFQYNVLSLPYLNKKDLLNNATAVSTKPSLSKSIYLDLRHQPIKKLWIRTPTADTSQLADRRLYDIADFHLATEGCQGATGSIGELWVTAIVTFTKPTTQFRNVPFDFFSWAFGALTKVDVDNDTILFQAFTPPGGQLEGGNSWAGPGSTITMSPNQPTSNFLGRIRWSGNDYDILDPTEAKNWLGNGTGAPSSVPAGTFGPIQCWQENNKAVTDFRDNWIYEFPPLISNYPSSVWKITWSYYPTGASVRVDFPTTGKLMCALCREITLSGVIGRTAGYDVVNNSGIVSVHYVKVDDNLTTQATVRPAVTFYNVPEFVEDSATADFSFNGRLEVSLIQVEHPGNS